MVGELGPLFKAIFRQAEQTDTRMGIRQEDPRDQRKKRDPREEEESASDMWEDSTGVSVEALRAFLINFVEGRTQAVSGEASESDEEQVAPQAPDVPEVRAPQDTRTARAMHAYQSQAEQSGSAYHAPPPSAPQSDVDLVHAEDVRLIHALIADLKYLADNGVETLVLEKSDTFLHALQEAVSRAKSNS